MAKSNYQLLTDAVAEFLDRSGYNELRDKICSANFKYVYHDNESGLQDWSMGTQTFDSLSSSLERLGAPLELGDDQSDESEVSEHSLQEIAAISILSQHGLINEYKRVLGDLEENLTRN